MLWSLVEKEYSHQKRFVLLICWWSPYSLQRPAGMLAFLFLSVFHQRELLKRGQATDWFGIWISQWTVTAWNLKHAGQCIQGFHNVMGYISIEVMVIGMKTGVYNFHQLMMCIFIYIQCDAVIAVIFIQNPHNRHPIACPGGCDMGVCYDSNISDLLSATTIAVSYVISW